MQFTKMLRSRLLELRDLRRLDARAAARRGDDSPLVTLSTTPGRIAGLRPTLVSLLLQDLAPREIHVNIGLDLFGQQPVPAFLEGLRVVQVQRVARDLGPATKLIPTLERLRGTRQRIVVVDDDMYYHRALLGQLVDAEAGGSGRECFCANGLLLPRSLRAQDCRGDRALRSGSRRVAVMQGAGGYCLRADLLDAEALLDLRGAPARAWFDDDVWFSGHLSRNGVVKTQVATGRRKSLANTLESAISGDRVGLMSELLEFFRKDWDPAEFAEA
ncbi:hypothetical protein [Thiomonas sp. FB-6]|uniref:hypothetical protein n=1 Tax=Thiomonas sp. FB-6 TaxID=1158291 RepID=UPI00037AE810|nr:hypothetical protein [Thiomonas sp. FB-6]